jgi:hypothetical protein
MEDRMRHQLRTFVRGAYDFQKLRIQTGNRVVANFKAKLGQWPSETEEDSLDMDGKKILADLRKRHDKLMDGVKSFPKVKNFKGDEVISSFTELCLVAEYLSMEANEDSHFLKLKHILKEFPIYTEFLEGVKGVGPAMAGIVIGEIDITQAEYASSLWKYAGLDVINVTKEVEGKETEVWEGRSRKKEHLREYEYIDSNGDTQTKMGITFNPFLKTKLIGVLGSSFLRVGKAKYSNAYYDYKHRLENMPAHAEKTLGHRHNMAIRYMIKLFLQDLYVEWRQIEGLPVAKPYAEAKLGLKHKVA